MARITFYACRPPLFPSPHCALGNRNNHKTSGSAISRKHSERLLSSLSNSPDPSTTHHIIRKFVASSSKSTALHALSLLLSQSSPLALPIYRRISSTLWFEWNPKLVAEVISVLESGGRSAEARELISESVSKLGSKRDIAHFYCDVIDAASDRDLKGLVLDCRGEIEEMGFVGKRPFESMIRGMSLMGMPGNADRVLDEMTHSGFKPSAFLYRMVIQGYGRLGLFDELEKVLEKKGDAGLEVDTVCANVVLSCYGDHGRLTDMVSWMRQMKAHGITYSCRTFNSVLNSCPTLLTVVEDLGTLPLSIEHLLMKLNNDEALLVQELASSSVLIENLKWSSSEGKLDLHGFHLASAYVIMLQWMELLRCRLNTDMQIVPSEIEVVCGSGKHSNVRGESPVKKLVSKLMVRLSSPMKIDRKNVGKFVAKGKAVRDWLCDNC